jgi:ribonuclease D
MTQHWTLVETPRDLAQAARVIGAAKTIAIDTEYDSFRYFRDKLCLLQIQTGPETWLIDPLAGLDLSCLGEVLNDPGILKVLHAGDNDIRILKRDYAFAFRNVFDTYLAASLLGHKQLGLGKLVESYLGISLEKKMQRSRWDLRPLRGEQLDYAALDTAHLADLHARLDRELLDKGLEKEARRQFVGLTAVVWRPKSLDRIGHRRLPGYATLSPGQREKARRLYRWRFEKGQEIDRAPFMILADSQLVALSRLEEVSGKALTGSGILKAEKGGRFGRELAELLRPQDEAPVPLP